MAPPPAVSAAPAWAWRFRKQPGRDHGRTPSASTAREGEGSTFWFTLPLVAAETHEPAGAELLRNLGAIGGCWWWTTTRPTARSSSTMCSAGGMRCAMTAVDGFRTALEQLRAGTVQDWSDAYDIAVVDMKMPRMDGIALVVGRARRSARLAGPAPGARHLAAFPRRAGRGRAAPACDAYLSKPVKRHDLFRALAQTVGEAVPEVAAVNTAANSRASPSPSPPGCCSPRTTASTRWWPATC